MPNQTLSLAAHGRDEGMRRLGRAAPYRRVSARTWRRAPTWGVAHRPLRLDKDGSPKSISDVMGL
jgi:hypothetical protein